MDGLIVDVHFRSAAAVEEDSIRELLTAAALPADDIAEHLQHFIVAQSGDRIIGSVGLELYAPIGLLRSLAVDPDYREHGIAKQLCKRLEEYARSNGIMELYLLTTTAAGYFEKREFVRIARDEAPKAIRQNKQFTTLCPSTAVCMKKNL